MPGRGKGTVLSFDTYWTAPSTHSVEFADSGAVDLDLQVERWALTRAADGSAPPEATWGETGTAIIQELGGALLHLGNARRELAGGSLTDITVKPGHAEGRRAAALFQTLETAVRGANRKGAAAQAAAKKQAECYMMMDDFAAVATPPPPDHHHHNSIAKDAPRSSERPLRLFRTGPARLVPLLRLQDLRRPAEVRPGRAPGHADELPGLARSHGDGVCR